MVRVYLCQSGFAFEPLMDTWYATKKAMLYIEQLGKIYYCPLQYNRQVDDSKAVAPYHRVDCAPTA